MKYATLLISAVCLWVRPVGLEAALTDDLVALYEFENDFLDTSGSFNANHGVPVNNPSFTQGKIGTAMSLTGLQDYMSLDSSLLTDLDFGNTDGGTEVDFTMSMWVRQDDFLSDPAVLSNKDWNNGNNTGINWAPKGNGIFDLNTKGSTGVRRDLDTLQNSFPLTVGQWNLVVLSIDRDGATQLYLNGVNRGTIPFSSTGSFNGGLPWNIGQDGTGNYSVEFTGAVDELAIWRRAIAPDEADQLWNGGAGIELGGQVVETRLKLVIDRLSGSMTIENNTVADQDLIGYQITSEAGAFRQSGWNPVSGRLDASGDGSLDADDNWLVGTSANSVSDFIEISLGTGTMAAGSTIELGSGLWAKYYQENMDVVFQYADGVGEELITGAVEFVNGPQGPFPFGFADLDFDGDLDREDWLKLQHGFGASLVGMSPAQRYRASDINNDSKHTLDDILEFQVEFDRVHGVGSFQAMINGVPEPTTMALLVLVSTTALVTRRRPQIGGVILLLLMLTFEVVPAQAANLFTENFDSVPLGTNVDETVAGANVWTAAAPTGWTIDNSGVPAGGVTEWRGWSFADPDWWSDAAEDQNRSQFTKGSGAIAVADPDEWDDLPRDAGLYDTFLQSPSISLTGINRSTVQMRFDSSWRPEDTQTATIGVSFNEGPASEILRWTSTAGVNFKPDSTNETVELEIPVPNGASDMMLEFGMTNAGNDWWWAIDNLAVFTPLTLQVDVQTGNMQILGDSSVALKGYEIFSPGGSNAPAGWQAGNLDAQGVGNALPAPADFNNSGTVDAADLARWNLAYGATDSADSDDDGDSDGGDFLRWQRQRGLSSEPASTWSTFLATQNQLIEAYLLGSSVFASDISLGAGYDVSKDLRDLQFTFTTDTNEKQVGSVQYVNLPAVTSVPEPAALLLTGVLVTLLLSCARIPALP